MVLLLASFIHILLTHIWRMRSWLLPQGVTQFFLAFIMGVRQRKRKSIFNLFQFDIFYNKEDPWLILKLSSLCSSFSSLRTVPTNIGAIPQARVWQRRCMMLFSMPQRMLYRNQNIFQWIMMNSPPLTIRFGYLFMFMWWKNKRYSPFCWTYKG